MANRFVLNTISYHGSGAIKEIPGELQRRGYKKIFVCSDPDLVKFGVTAKVTDELDAAGIAWSLYSEIKPNPTIQNVKDGVEAFKAAEADAIVTIGGGSSMDTAKAIGIIINNPEFADVRSLEGVAPTKNHAVFTIAVPTTAGSGSETTIAAVITNEKTHHKHAIMDLCLVPRYAVLDAVLTEELPPATTAQTGMDALTHAVEAYVSVHSTTKETDRCAEEATAAIFRYLERAYNDGHDLEARQEMLLASFKAGVAFTRAGVGNVHAIAHTLGGLYNTAHGLANAVILPIVLEDYGAAAEEKLARLAEITGTKTTGTAREKSAAFIAEIRAMNARMGIPEHLDMIREEDIPQMVAWALREANPTYPVPVLYDEAHCAEIIRRVRGDKGA